MAHNTRGLSTHCKNVPSPVFFFIQRIEQAHTRTHAHTHTFTQTHTQMHIFLACFVFEIDFRCLYFKLNVDPLRHILPFVSWGVHACRIFIPDCVSIIYASVYPKVYVFFSLYNSIFVHVPHSLDVTQSSSYASVEVPRIYVSM